VVGELAVALSEPVGHDQLAPQPNQSGQVADGLFPFVVVEDMKDNVDRHDHVVRPGTAPLRERGMEIPRPPALFLAEGYGAFATVDTVDQVAESGQLAAEPSLSTAGVQHEQGRALAGMMPDDVEQEAKT